VASHVDIAAELVYRGADGGAVLPYRQHFKRRWPGSKEFVTTDLDQILRRYSLGNPDGTYVKFEYKYVTFWRDIDPEEDQERPTWFAHEPMAHHQMRTLGLDDEICRKGDPEDPLTDADLDGKFVELAAPVIGDAAARAMLQQLWQLELAAQLP
jgi:hypothetical protein